MNYRAFSEGEHGKGLLIEKENGVHYVRGTRVRKWERSRYMRDMIAAAKHAREHRNSLRRTYPHCCFG